MSTTTGNPAPAAVAGIDSHKDTLAACVIDQAGRPVEHQTFPNTPQGHRKAIGWLQRRNIARVGIEGSGSYGRPLALRLAAQGVNTVEVPPQMTAQARRQQRTRQKTDRLDALAIARVAAREDDLPAPRCDETTDDLRSLVFYRRELVEARTAQINRLHADLIQLRPGYHKQLGAEGLATPKALNRVSRQIAKCPTTRAQVAKSRIKNIRQLLRQVQDLDAQIACLMDAIDTPLTDIHGIGTLTAAEIIAEAGEPGRYPTKAKFAMANGTAPIEASSGRVVRHRLNRGGNRRLNRALYYAALSQIARPGTEGRCFYERLLKQGKTKREALRILKRRISDRVWTHLQTTNI